MSVVWVVRGTAVFFAECTRNAAGLDLTPRCGSSTYPSSLYPGDIQTSFKDPGRLCHAVLG